MSEEQERWRSMLAELCAKFSLEYIAKEIGVSVRQVSNWKNGDRPLGFNAIRLYLFHGKHGTPVQVDRTPVHGTTQTNG